MYTLYTYERISVLADDVQYVANSFNSLRYRQIQPKYTREEMKHLHAREIAMEQQELHIITYCIACILLLASDVMAKKRQELHQSPLAS